ncbi:putative uncharacterized transposon-derived protein F52C9.6 [Chionoecetes opilio]|uniref:Uncharacterized transposon-derived protein F52C9.6 n=1 Tax=Chionoecetes opilio TaxID=41210 RepID=A0A8J4XNL1_CHIOP|nr:putative uncharacterized transposon-derived protein F52C9.6 [Chionoecetes opilio]
MSIQPRAYKLSINHWGHTPGGASPRPPYDATPGGHHARVPMQAPFSYQAALDKKHQLALATSLVGAPLASSTPDCLLQIQPDGKDQFEGSVPHAHIAEVGYDGLCRSEARCVLAPSLFNACMDWVLDKVVDQSDCGASVGNTKITDLVFADDAVIFPESLEVLVMALEALHEEAKPLGLEVSWLKTKVQVFGDLLDEAVQSVHACGEDIEILESFTYLGSAVHNVGGSRQEVLRRIGIAHGVMDSLSGSIWRCRYLCRRTKIRIFKSLVIPVLLYGSETWTLNSDLKRRINAFGNKCLHRIMGYRWDDYVSNQRLYREAESRPITCIVRQRQLRLYGHVARYPETDPSHRVVSVGDNPAWRRPRGRPQGSWLGQVDVSCRELLGMGN